MHTPLVSDEAESRRRHLFDCTRGRASLWLLAGDFASYIPIHGQAATDHYADYNWSPIEYVRNPQRTIQTGLRARQRAMSESGAEIFFLISRLRRQKVRLHVPVVSRKRQTRLTLDDDVESFQVHQRRRQASIFNHARRGHPAASVCATVACETELDDTRNTARGWATQCNYVHPDAAFFVFYRTDRTEQSVADYLKVHDRSLPIRRL